MYLLVLEILIEPGLREKIVERNRQLSDLFQYKSWSFKTVNEKLKTKDNFEQHVAICNNLDQLIDRMIQERNIDEIRIGLDGWRLWLLKGLSFCIRFWTNQKKPPGRKIQRFGN